MNYTYATVYSKLDDETLRFQGQTTKLMFGVCARHRVEVLAPTGYKMVGWIKESK